jgi:hypothetical protein
MSTFYKVRTAMNAFELRAGLRRLTLVLLLALPLSSPATDQQTFATPEAAVDALLTALKGNDEAALLALFGTRHRGLVVSGDKIQDAAVRANLANQLGTFHLLEATGKDRRIVLVGPEAWPAPIPLVRQGEVWRFATEEGIEEILNRRIGRNERSALQVLKAYLDAQRQYAAQDRDGDGVLQYARKLGSAPGKRDGLYWPADPAKGEEASPFGPLIAGGSADVAGRKAGDPYRGYHFRILTRQSKNAAGGAYNYVINGRLIAGFAMVAYPAEYGDSGVMSFIVNHNGTIYEKDLGEMTAPIGAMMTEFDPGRGWKKVLP